MHEFALARAARDTIVKHKKDRVKIYIGEIQQIDVELFKRLLIEETSDLNVLLEFYEMPAKMRCNVCFSEWLYRDLELTEDQKESIHFLPESIHIFVKCPKCSSNDFSIVEGRGIYIGTD